MLLALALAGCAPAPSGAAGPGAETGDEGGATPIVVVTFNTGTTAGLAFADGAAYGDEQAAISDAYYGDGLAWLPAVEAARAWFASVQPDLVGFQEIFYAGDCVDVPASARAGFYCETWTPGAPIVTEAVLGDAYQVACHPGHPDKCAAVKRSFGTFRGCEDDFCLEGLDGATVEGCGSGARVGRGTVDRVDGNVLTFVNVHGSSGVSADDEQCRVRQIEQVFDDLDGSPAANGAGVGAPNVVLGDLNTDPGRWASFDASAARWLEEVGGDGPFAWVTEVGADAPLTYQGVATIDHVVSDTYGGECWHAGVTEGHAAVFDPAYFDHVPAVCELVPRPAP